MIYIVELSIPANTSIVDPAHAVLGVNLGVVTQVWVRWRWGSGNLCGVVIKRAGVQTWPLPGDTWFVSRLEETTWQENLHVDDYPLFFDLYAYNLDDTFPHTVSVFMNLQQSQMSQSAQNFVELLTRS